MGRSALATAVAALWLAPAGSALTVSVKLNPATIRRGQSARLSGMASPAASGTFVELQLRHGHSWRNQASAELRLSDRFSFTIRGRSKGKYGYRIAIKASSATSKVVTLTVT